VKFTANINVLWENQCLHALNVVFYHSTITKYVYTSVNYTAI